MTEPVDRLDHSVIFIRNSINHISSLGYSDNLKNDYFNRSWLVRSTVVFSKMHKILYSKNSKMCFTKPLFTKDTNYIKYFLGDMIITLTLSVFC